MGGRLKPRAHGPAKAPSASEVRRLGVAFLAAACMVGALAAWKARGGGWPWQAWPAMAFAAAGTCCISLGARAAWVHRAWTALGSLLGRIVSPIVLSALYYVVVTPFGLAYRVLRKDPLGLRPDRSAATYWRKPAQGRTSREKLLRQY